ncbi:hypothetical protein [Eoetvoesiella caeni]
MLIDATQPSGTSLQDVDETTAICWFIKFKPSDQMYDRYRMAVIMAFETFANKFNLVSPIKLDETMDWPKTLLHIPGIYSIEVSSEHRIDSINSKTMEGFGEIQKHHGYLPLIALWLVQCQLKSSGLAGEVIVLDQDNNPTTVNHFSALKQSFVLLGFDYEKIVKDVDQVGLLPSLYASNFKPATQGDNFYF